MLNIVTAKLLKRPKNFSRDQSGKLTTTGLPKFWNKDYAESSVKYLNCLEPLFEKAQKKSDFQFIFSLLRFRGIQSSGEDAYQNSLETIDTLMDIKDKIKGRARLNVFLWVYGHIVESSEPYETIANLLHICAGRPYRAFNFPYEKTSYGYRPVSPIKKIKQIEKLAEEVKMPDILDPIKEIFDRDLRNAVFHSDYSAYRGEVFISNPTKIYPRGAVLSLVNKALAYHEAMKNLIKSYTESYSEPRIINVTPGFSVDPEERAQIIVRKKHGVVGMKDAWTGEQLKSGKQPWYCGNTFSYEQKLINNGRYLLPENRVDFWNKILIRVPGLFYKKAEVLVEKYIINR